MKRKLLAAALCLTMAFSYTPSSFYAEDSNTETAQSNVPDNKEEGLKVGDRVEDFTITLTDGSEFTLSEALKDHKAVFVNIWATYCKPCRKEFPAINKAANKYSDDVYVLAASGYAKDDNSAVAAYKEALDLDLHMAGYDPVLRDVFPFEYFPSSYMINQDGILCWQAISGRPDEHVFDYLFKTFAENDSPDSLVGFELPTPSPELYGVQSAPEEELADALQADSSVFTFHNSESPNVWPFHIAEGGGLTASNAGFSDSLSALKLDVKASAGDVLRISTTQNVPVQSQFFQICPENGDETIYLLDQPHKEIDYIFEENTEDGIQHLSLEFLVGFDSPVSQDQFFTINSVRLLTGDEAGEAKKTVTSYPAVLDGSDMTVELADDLEELHFWVMGDDITGQLGNVIAYLAEEPVRVRVKIGTDINPDHILFTDQSSDYAVKLSDFETDETGFIITVDPSELRTIDNPSITISVFCPISDAEAKPTIRLFPDQESLNAFCKTMSGYANTTFAWGDENGPAESAVDTPSDQTEAADNEQTVTYDGYAFRFVDQNGDPVEGASLLICDDSSCCPYTSDADGMVQFDMPGTNFQIHVLMVPEGYSFDTSKEIEVPLKGLLIPITVEKQ